MASAHRQVFVDLVTAHGWTSVAELGVDKGILTGMLLRACPDLHLTAVDTFPDRQRSRRVFEFASEYPYLRILESTTAEASLSVADHSFDAVFIDADHSYAAVKSDIRNWSQKVKPGGWFGGHDYHPTKFPGVVKAVNEAFGRFVAVKPGTVWSVFL